MANNLYNTMYNPDVLSCIANLSNDEVFTPPEVANAMLDLLPQELFSDPNTTFLDIITPILIQFNYSYADFAAWGVSWRLRGKPGKSGCPGCFCR